jgi:hypothetical protein
MTIGEILTNLWGGFVEIFKPMFVDFSLFWYLGPILLFWLILEVYFSKYKTEELGWNTALGNGLSVFWVLTISMKYLFDNKMENFEWIKFIALLVMMLYAVFIIINSFSHKLRDKVSFLLASPTIIYYLSGIAILWTYGNLEITMWVLIDLIIFYGFVLLIELILKKMIKGKESGIEDMGLGKGSESKETKLGGNLSGGGFGRL